MATSAGDQGVQDNSIPSTSSNGEQDNFPRERVRKKISWRACNVLRELREAGQLCDATLMTNTGQTFDVHKAILSASSPYFRALFTGNFKERNRSLIKMSDITAEILDIIIEYAYTRESNLNKENVQEVIVAADMLGIVGLIEQCGFFLKHCITPENVIGIRKFSDYYSLIQLTQEVNKFLLKNFVQVSVESEEFLELDFDEFITLIRHDELNAKAEERVFEAVIKWLQFDLEERKVHFFQILKSVRLGLIPTPYFVDKIKKHPLIRDNEQLRPIIIEALTFLYNLDLSVAREIDLSNPVCRPRIPHEVLFVIGGWSGGSATNIIEAYDSRADRWTVVATLDLGPRAYHGTAFLNAKLYIIGGFDGMDQFNSCRCFDPIDKKWSEIAPMNYRRCYVSVCTMDGIIYAIGGCDRQIRQNTAESYNPVTNQWSLLPSMHARRSDASCTGLNGKVFICGGFNGEDCLNSAEYYDVETNSWTLLPLMRSRRSGVGVIACANMVYAVGGFNGIARLNTGECYNLQTNTWMPILEMFTQRSNYAIEVIDDLIFAIGGFDGTTTINSVECYDPNTNEWYDATDMNIDRSACSATIVYDLPNIRDYVSHERDNSRRRAPQNAIAGPERSSDNENVARLAIEHDELEDLL